MTNKRSCAGCSVCCWESYVPDLDKKVHTNCIYQYEGGCRIHDQAEQPLICKLYQCAWKLGYGDDWSKPSNSGLIVDIMKMENEMQPFIYAREHQPDALLKGLTVICDLIYRHSYPAIVVDYGTKPPSDTGNRVVLSDSLLNSTKRMRGQLLDDLGSGFYVYELIKQAA